jgi:hypothetical protein
MDSFHKRAAVTTRDFSSKFATRKISDGQHFRKDLWAHFAGGLR